MNTANKKLNSEIIKGKGILKRVAVDTLPFALLIEKYKLTHCEVDVAKLLVLGQSDSMIKRNMGVSMDTVREHLKHIQEKIGGCSRLEIVNLLINI